MHVNSLSYHQAASRLFVGAPIVSDCWLSSPVTSELRPASVPQYWRCVATGDTAGAMALACRSAKRNPSGAYEILGWDKSREKTRKYDVQYSIELAEMSPEARARPRASADLPD